MTPPGWTPVVFCCCDEEAFQGCDKYCETPGNCQETRQITASFVIAQAGDNCAEPPGVCSCRNSPGIECDDDCQSGANSCFCDFDDPDNNVLNNICTPRGCLFPNGNCAVTICMGRPTQFLGECSFCAPCADQGFEHWGGITQEPECACPHPIDMGAMNPSCCAGCGAELSCADIGGGETSWIISATCEPSARCQGEDPDDPSQDICEGGTSCQQNNWATSFMCVGNCARCPNEVSYVEIGTFNSCASGGNLGAVGAQIQLCDPDA